MGSFFRVFLGVFGLHSGFGLAFQKGVIFFFTFPLFFILALHCIATEFFRGMDLR